MRQKFYLRTNEHEDAVTTKADAVLKRKRKVVVDKGFCRMEYWLVNSKEEDAAAGNIDDIVVVHYLGDHTCYDVKEPVHHANARRPAALLQPFIRSDPAVLERVRRAGLGARPKELYDSEVRVFVTLYVLSRSYILQCI